MKVCVHLHAESSSLECSVRCKLIHNNKSYFRKSKYLIGCVFEGDGVFL
jgi:hypothetical protein